MNTPRRSRRGQPVVASVPLEHRQQDIEWIGEPIFTRPATNDDLREEGRKDEDEKLDSELDLELLFYRAFSRVSSPVLSSSRGKNRSRRDQEEGDEYEVGDTVLIHSNARLPSIGVITSMWEVRQKDIDEDDDEQEPDDLMNVKIHWFLRPTELPRIRAPREHYENEIYFSLSNCAVLKPANIIGHCSVTSKRPQDSTPKSSIAWASYSTARALKIDAFFCNHALNDLRGLYYDFSWEKHRKQALATADEGDTTGLSWKIFVKETVDVVKRGRKRAGKKVPVRDENKGEEDRSGDEESDYSPADNDDEDDEEETDHEESEVDADNASEESEDELALPTTPSKRKRKSPSMGLSTPLKRKKRKTLAVPTPHTKRALKSRRARKARSSNMLSSLQAAEFTYGHENLENLPSDPWLRAMQVLHVAARPEALPCREEEFVKILKAVESLLEEGSGGCIYISGVPGTGKTATVHAVVRELKRMAERNEVNPFSYVEINGLKIPEPAAAYPLLWEAVSGHDTANDGHLKVSPKESLKHLAKHFGTGHRTGPAGHACVVLMDELDQLMTTKQDVVYNFFNWPTMLNSKLVVIAVANTMDLPERVMNGRVRSRLGMVRINFQPYTTPQLVKIVHARLEGAKKGLPNGTPDTITVDGVKFAAMKVSSISGDARRVLDICRRVVETVQPHQRSAKTEDVKDVIKLMQSSPTAAFLRDCSLHERIMLAALLKCARRSGIEEVKWSDVQNQHLNYTNVLIGDEDSARKPTFTELGFVLDSLVGSRAMLIEEGAAAAKKADGDRRVILNIEQSEVERVLGEIGGQRWKNALGV